MDLDVKLDTMSSIGGSISIVRSPRVYERESLISAECRKKSQDNCSVVCRIIAAGVNTVKRV